MAEARQRDAWARAAGVMALLAEPYRDPEKRSQPFTPADFDPFADKTASKPPPVPKVDFATFKRLFARR